MTTRQKTINMGLVMAAVVYGLGALLLLSGVAGRVAWAFLASFTAVAVVTLAWATVQSVMPHIPRPRYEDPWVAYWETLMRRPCR